MRQARSSGDASPTVGLIVNPFSGRDVRRLVAPAGSLTNHERMTMVQCVLGGLYAAGVRQVLFMPEPYALVPRAAAHVPDLIVRPALEGPAVTPADTVRSAAAMTAAGVVVIITVGGDGTDRLTALGAGATPLLPLPAGTNNAFADPVEPTAAGIAAGMVARGGRRAAIRAGVIRRRKRIRVSVGGRDEDALVDAVATSSPAVGARALWDPAHVRALMVTQAMPGALGLSSLVAALLPITRHEPRGAFVEMGPGITISALLAPGMVTTAEVRSVRPVPVGATVHFGPCSGTLSLDGERAFELRNEIVPLALAADGPWVVDAERALWWAQRVGLFVTRDLATGEGSTAGRARHLGAAASASVAVVPTRSNACTRERRAGRPIRPEWSDRIRRKVW